MKNYLFLISQLIIINSNYIVNIVTIIPGMKNCFFFFLSLLYLNFNNDVSIDLADLIVY